MDVAYNIYDRVSRHPTIKVCYVSVGCLPLNALRDHFNMVEKILQHIEPV